MLFHFKFDPTQIITAWTMSIAVISLLNKFLLMPYLPNVARFISAIISIPTGHLANFIEDIQQLWTDVIGGPPAPPAGPTIVSKPTNPPPPPAALRGRVGFAVAACAVLACAITAGGAIESCTPAQSATWTKVEEIVLADIQAGKSEPQIEQDVAQVLAGQPGVDAVIVLNDVLTFLIDTGTIPPNWLPRAQVMLAQVGPEAIAHRAALKVSQ
jgi:hypothetical protein